MSPSDLISGEIGEVARMTYFSAPSKEPEIELTFNPFEGVTEYIIYTGRDWERMKDWRLRMRAYRKTLHKRKKQARARTGRR
jgi:hypothetical protein